MIKPEPARGQSPTRFSFLHLLFTGLTLLAIYFSLSVLLPLPQFHFPAFPDPASWQLQLSHALFADAWAHTNHPTRYVLLLTGLLVLLSLLYLFSVQLVVSIERREKSNIDTQINRAYARTWLLIIYCGAVIFGGILLFQPTLFSGEVFGSIMAGRMLSIYHVDPLVTLPAHFSADPLSRLIPTPNQPLLYGPLWLEISALLTGLTTQFQGTLLLFKALALLTHLLNICLIWSLLGRLLPHSRISGTLLYAWNPLVLIELAGNGQNMGLVLSLLLLALLFHLQQRRLAEIGPLLLLGIASSLSFLVLLLLPLYAWYLAQGGTTSWQVVRGFCWRLGLGLVGWLIPFIPIWQGSSTFLAYTSLLDLQHALNTPLEVIIQPIQRVFAAFVHALKLPPKMDPTSSAEVLVKTIALLLFGLLYSSQFSLISRMKNFSDRPSPFEKPQKPVELPALLASWQRSMFWSFICIVTPFWSWYTLPVLGLASLFKNSPASIALLLLSCSLLFAYPLQQVIPPALSLYLPILTFGIPLIYILITKSRFLRKDLPS